MQKVLLSLSVSFLIFSCSTTKSGQISSQKVGGDMKNGCKPSAGYQWSHLESKCVRPFEAGIKLNSATNSNTASYIIVNKKEIELFSAEFPHSIILPQQSENHWKKGGWEVEFKDNEYSLKQEGVTLYKN